MNRNSSFEKSSGNFFIRYSFRYQPDQARLHRKRLALQLEYNAREYGADGLAFEAIVAAGVNSALPHAQPTDRKIKKGDFVVIDFGVKYKGYCSDETCTIAFGKLTDRQKNAYQIVKDAHDRALAMIKEMFKPPILITVRGAFSGKNMAGILCMGPDMVSAWKFMKRRVCPRILMIF